MASAQLPSKVRYASIRGTAVSSPSALVLLELRAELLLLGLQLRRERGAQVLGLVDGPDLDHRLVAGGIRALLHPVHRLLDRLHLPDPEARDQLLGLGERAVHHPP